MTTEAEKQQILSTLRFWFSVEAESKKPIERNLEELEAAVKAAEGIEAVDPHPADNVSYAPCVRGTVEIGDTTTAFMLTKDAGWSQWGATNEVLGSRVDLLDNLGSAWTEWADENLCSECQENLLDDGEGYDGKCGDCADKREGGIRTVGARVIWTDPDGGQRKAGKVQSTRDGGDELYVAFDDGGYADVYYDELEKEEE